MTTNVVTHQIEIRRQFTRTPVEDSLISHVTGLVKSFQGKYKLELVPQTGESRWYAPLDNRYPCDISIMFTLTGPDHNEDDVDYQTTLANLNNKLQQIKTGRSADTKYRLHGVDGSAFKPMNPRQMMQARVQKMEGMVEYADIDMPSADMLAEGMNGLFELDAQIDLVVTSIQRAIEQDFKFRDHLLLVGDPGCGKSETLMRIAAMLEAMGYGNAILKIDGTSMTSAGIADILKEIPVMPRIMIVEEIDKADNAACSVFLGLMDKRGEVRKATYRDQFSRDGRMLVLATANNWDKIVAKQEGALASRFGNPVQYKRPSPNGMLRIMHRELDEQDLAMCCKPIITTDKDGNENRTRCEKCKECKRRDSWISRTLEWCAEWKSKLVIDTSDPRFAIKMLVSGQDKLISGVYQRNLEATSLLRPEVKDWKPAAS